MKEDFSIKETFLLTSYNQYEHTRKVSSIKQQPKTLNNNNKTHPLFSLKMTLKVTVEVVVRDRVHKFKPR